MKAVVTQRRQIQLLVAGMAGLALVGVGGGAMSLAVFTDQQSASSSFTSGTVLLDATKIAGLNLAVSGMLPGSSITDDVVVQNNGTAQLRYAVSQTSTDDSSPNGPALYTALTLVVKTVEVTTPGTPCNDFDGTQLVSQTLSATGNVVGDPATGASAGDRTLAAAGSETLCFRVSLPIGTGNTFQGAASTTTFTFDAEQTLNN